MNGKQEPKDDGTVKLIAAALSIIFMAPWFAVGFFGRLILLGIQTGWDSPLWLLENAAGTKKERKRG